MKSERRHDLEKNELATRLALWLERISPYTSHILLGGLLFVGLYVASNIWGSFSSAKEQAAWDAYTLASYGSDPEMMALQRLAEDEQYAGTKMQEWAYLTWADRQVLLASQSYLFDRESTKDRLTRVLGVYEQLASGANDRQVQDRARYGLAQAYEMQNKVEEARKAYSQVSGDLATLARDRASQLESDRVQEATAWLATATLPRRQTSLPPDGPPRPAFGIDAPAATLPDAALQDTRSLEEILMGMGVEAAGDAADGEESIDEPDEPAVELAEDANSDDEETTE